MANAIPGLLTSLTFDSTDLQRSDLSVQLQLVAGLNDGQEVRGADTVIPSAVGRRSRKRVGDVRHLLVAGPIQGSGDTEAEILASYQGLRDEMETLFDVAGDPAVLSGLALDGSTRSITARTTSIIWNDVELGYSELSIALDAADPVWTVVPADPGP